VRGYQAQGEAGDDGPGAVVLVRDAGADLFSLGTAEARAAGLAEAAALDDVDSFGEGTVEPATLNRAVARVALAPTTTVTIALTGEVWTIALAPADRDNQAQLIALGMDLQRTRSALAAENLASRCVSLDPPTLEVGPPPRP
jgi:coenzyme F420-0:L-glutamate ligase/coenzyme F420-1:gamma-L-glutamate ligase